MKNTDPAINNETYDFAGDAGCDIFLYGGECIEALQEARPLKVWTFRHSPVIIHYMTDHFTNTALHATNTGINLFFFPFDTFFLCKKKETCVIDPRPCHKLLL